MMSNWYLAGSSQATLITTWDWSVKCDLPINPVMCNNLTIGWEVQLRLAFSPDGSGTAIPEPELIYELGVHMDSTIPPST